MATSPQLYQARCICGQNLEISVARLGRHIVCPMCSRTLIPISATLVDQTDDVSPRAATPAEIQRPCPSCGEMILKVARKCRHCGEFLEPSGDARTTDRLDAGPPSDAADQPMSDAVFDVVVSQWDNFWRYLTCLIILVIAAGAYKLPPLRPYAGIIFAVVLTVDVFAAFLIYLSSRNTRCLINSDRVETQSGIFTKQIDWISIRSVTDVQLRQSFLQRLLGIGSINIRSNDQVTPLMEIHHIPQARKVFEYMQQQSSRSHNTGPRQP